MTRYDEFLAMRQQETDDCILWPHGKSSNGYGQIWVSGQQASTHRLSCEMAHGAPPTPEHTGAAHSCRNRHCLNPRHLRWATPTENQNDRIKDGTSIRGERHGMAKLTEFDVRAICHYVKCGTQQKVLADHFGVTQTQISRIVHRKSWTHLEGAV